MWMPDGQSIVFSGLSESGISDLYRVRLPRGTLEPLTATTSGSRPQPQPRRPTPGLRLRPHPGGLEGAVNVFMLDLGTGTVAQLTRGKWVDESPSWGPDGRIYFTSDRDGVLNIFSMDTLGSGRRETSAWTGAFDPVASQTTEGSWWAASMT